MNCPATSEAVQEQEKRGHLGCPICGRGPSAHPSEVMADIKRTAYDAKVREMRRAS